MASPFIRCFYRTQANLRNQVSASRGDSLNPWIATKAKGRFLSRDLALSVPIFGDPDRPPDHNVCYPEITQHPRAVARVSLALPRSHSPQKFFTVIRLQLPGASIVADS